MQAYGREIEGGIRLTHEHFAALSQGSMEQSGFVKRCSISVAPNILEDEWSLDDDDENDDDDDDDEDYWDPDELGIDPEDLYDATDGI